jgi:two-component system chemotaxis response regulator CheY
MLVDDSAFMRAKCVKLLISSGYEVVEATNGAEAIEQYELQRPDVVLLDITMPGMDGLTALRELIRIDPGARVAMVTALDQQGITAEALLAGARAFVVKPFKPDKVLAAVDSLLV